MPRSLETWLILSHGAQHSVSTQHQQLLEPHDRDPLRRKGTGPKSQRSWLTPLRVSSDVTSSKRPLLTTRAKVALPSSHHPQ